ncbi:MAG: NAD(P)-dependent oxidoreductase [Alphaproteobacteria bacterium]|nr:NAD(P)-dependent oxidoreductase [Alphaproteobacteria bacterium]
MSDAAKLSVGVIGLGSMGMGMARSLARGGLNLKAYYVNPKAVAAISDVGKGVSDHREAARDCDILVCAVVNAKQTRDVLLSAKGAVHAMKKDGFVISCATMAPDEGRAIGALVHETGRFYLDAPISGGPTKAASGQMTIMASGTEDAFTRARPALEAMAAKIYELGLEIGIGASFKMINQFLAGVHIAAACEATSFAAKLVLDLHKVFEVITASAGNSWMFENRVPHILDGDYSPKSAVSIFTKDLGIISDMGRSEKFPLSLSAAALQMFLMTAAAGMERYDDASVARLLANIAGVKLPEPK